MGDHAIVVEGSARIVDAAAAASPGRDGAVARERRHGINFKARIGNLRRAELVVAEAVGVDRISFERRVGQGDRSGRRDVAVGEADAVVVAELILVHREAVVAHAEGGGARAVLPADRVDGRHVERAGDQSIDGDRRGKSVVEKVVGQLPAPAGDVVGVVGEDEGQSRRGERRGGRIATAHAGEGDAVDDGVHGGTKAVGVRVALAAIDARGGVVVPRGVGPAAVAHGDAEVIDDHGVVAAGVIAQRHRLGCGGRGEIEREKLVGIGPAHGRDGGVDDVHGVDIHLEVRRVAAARIDAEVHLVGGADGQAGDRRAQRGGGAVLNEGDLAAVGDGAVVGEGAAAGRIQAGTAAGGPVVDGAIGTADVAGEGREGVGLETGIGNGCSQRTAGEGEGTQQAKGG